ncbi:MAG: hypothetical protein ACUVQM_04370 [Candidatus Hadarchaeaceae archaeon]
MGITMAIPDGVKLEGKTPKLMSSQPDKRLLKYYVHDEIVTFTVPHIC